MHDQHSDMFCLNSDYSTTRLVTREKPVIVNKPEDKFETVLFLPEGEHRTGQGGLRTQGLFKRSLPDKPLITVITVVLNGAKHLEETILSVLNQTYDNVEYIVIDGGSTDETLDIIRKYEHGIDYWVSEKDAGISNAFNKGVMCSSGLFINLLNSADKFINNSSIIYFVKILSAEDNIVSFQAKTDTGAIFPKKNRIKNEYSYAHQSTFIKINVYKNIGLYNNKYKIRMDYDFFVRAEKKLQIQYIECPIIIYNTLGISSMLKNRFFFKKEEFDIITENFPKKNTIIYAIFFFTGSFFFIIKKIISKIYYILPK